MIEVAAVGAKGHIELFGRLFLRGGGLKIGVGEGTVRLELAGVGL